MSEDTKVNLRRRTDRPLSNAPESTDKRVQAALAVLEHFGKPKDLGYCGPKGRVILARADTRAGYMMVTLSRQHDRYEVTYTMHVINTCEPMDVFHDSFRIGSMMRTCPTFTPSDTEGVFSALDAIFGKGENS